MADNAATAGVVYFGGAQPVFAERHDYHEEMAHMQTVVDADAPDVPTDRGAHAAAGARGKKKSPAQLAAIAAQRSIAFSTIAALEIRAQR